VHVLQTNDRPQHALLSTDLEGERLTRGGTPHPSIARASSWLARRAVAEQLDGAVVAGIPTSFFTPGRTSLDLS
jgi:hypothetical protein